MKFKPAWWLTNKHLQTLWPLFCRKPTRDIQLTTERFELSDGDFVDLCWVGEGAGPIVIMLHGLEGSIESHYAKSMLKIVAEKGWRGLFVHFRGCSGEPNRLSRGYHSGDTGDVAEIVAAIREREPKTLLAAIGVSLGGNVLLKWLGETGRANPLTAAVAISVPFELMKTAETIQRGFSKLYQWHFLKCLNTRLTYKYRQQPAEVSLPAFDEIRTMQEFDDLVTAPLHGFQSGEHYYTACSCRQFLHAIQVPTLIINAKDDPIVALDAIPSSGELSPQVQLELTENGGHVGFVAGQFPWRSEYWLEKRVPSFLEKKLAII